MCDITLTTARYFAKHACSTWHEVCSDEKRKVIVLRPSDTSSAVRRVVVNYGDSVIRAVLNDGEGKSTVVKRTNATSIVLGRLLEKPSLHKVLGFGPVRSCGVCTKQSKNKKDCGVAKSKKCKAVCEKCKPKSESKCATKCKRVCKAKRTDMHDELDELKEKIEKLNKMLQGEDKEEKKPAKKKEDDNGYTPRLRSYVGKTVRSDLNELSIDAIECLQLLPDGNGFVHTEKDGGVYWSADIDAKAGDCLEGSTKKDRPEALCVGTHGRYFVRFSGGSAECNGPAEVKQMVKFGNVRMVAFGGAEDSYAVVFENGNVVSNNIPASLHRLVCECAAEGVGVDYVSLGPSGEYFIRYGNKVQYGNLCEMAGKALDECPGRIIEVTFGDEDALVARFEVKK